MSAPVGDLRPGYDMPAVVLDALAIDAIAALPPAEREAAMLVEIAIGDVR